MKLLEGKTAIITGASRGIGKGIATVFAQHGANVAFTYSASVEAANALETELKAYGTTVKGYQSNAANFDEAQQLAIDVLADFGGIDILINNAAIDPKVIGGRGILESSRLENFELDQWNLQVNVGLTGAFLCTKHFGSAMARDGCGGVILNISSDLSVISPDQRLYRRDDVQEHLQPVKPVTYSVIKSGLIGLTKYLATYWADKGVRCNALSPGGIYSGQGEDFVSKLTSLIPISRMALADEYRSSIQYLCSDASSYMNGQNVVVDGGRSVW